MMNRSFHLMQAHPMQAGFTLIEIMGVLVVIGLLALSANTFVGRLESAYLRNTVLTLDSLSRYAMDAYVAGITLPDPATPAQLQTALPSARVTDLNDWGNGYFVSLSGNDPRAWCDVPLSVSPSGLAARSVSGGTRLTARAQHRISGASGAYAQAAANKAWLYQETPQW